MKTNAWINANPDEAKAAANEQLEADSGKALPGRRPRPGLEVHPDHRRPAGLDPRAPRPTHAVKAGLLEKPDLKGIYDLTLLNKVLKAEGESPVDDAGLGVK